MVGGTGIEPVTPCVSSKCSTAELTAHLNNGMRRSFIGKYSWFQAFYFRAAKKDINLPELCRFALRDH